MLDGEIVIPVGRMLSFDELLLRIHPAASRVRTLAAEHPAMLIVFDLLVDDEGRSLVKEPLSARRAALEAFATKHLAGAGAVRLSPATTSERTVKRWYASVGSALDGVIAKRLDLPYQTGERTGMQKLKQKRTADCVVGGFRYASKGRVVGSLLLGLYDEEGLLNHVGFCSAMSAKERAALTPELEALRRKPGFTGQAPGGPSRWSTARTGEWEPLATKLVVEVEYDHFTGGRFRHGTGFLRWRPDKAPAPVHDEAGGTGGGVVAPAPGGRDALGNAEDCGRGGEGSSACQADWCGHEAQETDSVKETIAGRTVRVLPEGRPSRPEDSMKRVYVLFGLCAAVAGCAVSTQQEVQMGQQYSSQLNTTLPVIHDAEVDRYVNQLGDSIAHLTGRGDLDWHFFVVNTDVVNAFALPGGYIYVNRGVIERADKMDELAGVIGHEIGHVVKRHSVKQMQQQQGAKVGVALTCVLTNVCESQHHRRRFRWVVRRCSRNSAAKTRNRPMRRASRTSSAPALAPGGSCRSFRS